LIIDDQAIEFSDYETIVQFLQSLLKLLPGLLTAEVVVFLRLAGVKVYESLHTMSESAVANDAGSSGMLQLRRRYSLTKRDLELYNNSSRNSRSSSVLGSPRGRSPPRSPSMQSPIMQLEAEDFENNTLE